MPLSYPAPAAGTAQILAFPAEFRWDQTLYPVSIIRTGRSVELATDGLEMVNPACWTGPAYHVDPLTGDDAKTGLGVAPGDYTNAVATMDRAQELLNATGAPGRILVRYRAGIPIRRRVSTARVWAVPTVATLVVGDGGRPVIQAANKLTWAQWPGDASGKTYVASEPLAAADSRVFYTRVRNAEGAGEELISVASAAAVAAAPGTWARVGTDVYVRLPDSSVVDDNNVCVTLNLNILNITQSTPSGCGFLNLQLEGGYPLDLLHTSSAAAHRQFYFRDCLAGGSRAQYSGWRCRNSPGRVRFDRCRGYRTGTDEFNTHWSYTDGSLSSMHVIVNNPKGWMAGGGTTEVSCNTIASHKSTEMLVLGIDSWGDQGASISAIDNSRILVIGGSALGSVGDKHVGGGYEPTAVQASNDAAVYLDGVTIGSGYYAVRAMNTARVRGRNVTVLSGSLTATETATIDLAANW